MSPKCPRLPWVPGSPVACPGGQGRVIYCEDENLSRKFVPINIAVPGSGSLRPSGGGAAPAAPFPAECPPLARGKGRRGNFLGPLAQGRGRTCSDTQGARAQRIGLEQRAVGPGGQDANQELRRGRGKGEGSMNRLPEAARPRRFPKRKLVREAGILL